MLILSVNIECYDCQHSVLWLACFSFFLLSEGHGYPLIYLEDRSGGIWTFRFAYTPAWPTLSILSLYVIQFMHCIKWINYLRVCVCLCFAGQYLVERIIKDGAGLGLTLAFAWNRNPHKLKGLVPDHLILEDLSAFKTRYSHTHQLTK